MSPYDSVLARRRISTASLGVALSLCVISSNALEGDSSGTIFQEPPFPKDFKLPGAPDFGSAVVSFPFSAQGFTWGDGTPSSFFFSGDSFNDATGFSVGTFSYFNGASGSGTGVQYVDLNLQLNLDFDSDTVVDDIQNFIFTLNIENTGNDTDVNAINADRVRFVNRTASSQIDAPGGPFNLTLSFELPTIALSEGFLSEEDVDGFANSFHVYEGKEAQATLIARVYTGPALENMNSVPDVGSTLLLLTMTLGIMGASKGYRRNEN